MSIFQTHDVSVAFEVLVQAARVRGHGHEILTRAAIAYVAQLAIDVGGYDVAMIRLFEARLTEIVQGGPAQRHVAHIESDPESLRRGGSTRVAACSCGWRGPERAALEMVADDALEHEKASPS